MGRRAVACIGNADRSFEEFDFSFEHLGFVLSGLGYQAWGLGGHFSIRREPGGCVIEFQGSGDRSPVLQHLSDEQIRSLVAELEGVPVGRTRVRLF